MCADWLTVWIVVIVTIGVGTMAALCGTAIWLVIDTIREIRQRG